MPSMDGSLPYVLAFAAGNWVSFIVFRVTMRLHLQRIRREQELMTEKAKTEPSDPMLQFFRYQHLPEHLQAVSAPFARLAAQVADNLPRNPERTVCLRKLLEAKDAAVRTVLYEAPSTPVSAEQLDRMAPVDPRD